MNISNSRKRIWEIDFARGIAVIFMIYFHIIFDMKELYGYTVVYDSGFNYYVGKLSAVLFILTSGISSTISRNNSKRALKILGVAMIATVISHLYEPQYGIKFGILHFMGICILLYHYFSRLSTYLLFFTGFCIFVLDKLLSRLEVNFDYLFPLGITSSGFVSSDYYPLIPWMGVFLFGAALGKMFYSSRQSLFRFELSGNIISKAGKRTLRIYVIHQPVILAVLSLVKFITKKLARQ